MAAARRIPLRAQSWHPYRDVSRLFDQSFGLAVPPEVNIFPSAHWPEHIPMRSVPTWASQLSRQINSGLSEIKQSPGSWKVSLDVNHFSPEELEVKTKDGVLEITGKHEEREDDHGFVSRHFVRKYTLPPGAEMEHMTSSLSPEGVLTVEAPLPKPAIKAPEATTIPINVHKDSIVKKD